jgi:guanylate kinase
MNRVQIITITGPSGVGKTTIVGALLKERPELSLIVSPTSRPPRESDLPGEYCTVRRMRFVWLEITREFLWTVDAHGNLYGTLRDSVDEALAREHPSLMILVPERVEFIRRYALEGVLSLFILPPSEEVLRARLAGRGENPEVIARRIEDCRAWEQIARVSDSPYNFISNEGSVEDAVREVFAHLPG